jgi:hypothetical protein
METTHSEKRRGGVLVSRIASLPRREPQRATRRQRRNIFERLFWSKVITLKATYPNTEVATKVRDCEEYAVVTISR